MIVSYAVAWGMIAAVIYIVSEVAQRFFYDQIADGLWWRSIVAAVPLAFLIAHFPAQLDEMFTSGILGTLLQAAAWVLVFRFVCLYETPHAFFAGLSAFFLTGWMVTMALASIATKVPVP